MPDRATIGIAGSYGGLNLGDEAILTSMTTELRGAIPEASITVFSRDPEHTRRHHRVDRVLAARDAVREEIEPALRDLDLLLLGGGGILYDREARSHLHLVALAQDLGVPTAAFAIGAGPLDRSEDRKAVAGTLNGMRAITVRDAPAKRLLEETGVLRDITVTADPAVLLEPEPFSEERLRAEGITGEHPLVGMSVREPGGAVEEIDEDGYHVLLANAADFIVDRFDADLLFVPMERGDIRESHRVVGHMGMPERAKVLSGAYPPRQVLGLVHHLDLAVGMRLHFLIFAAVAGVPLQALPYASKVAAFLDAVGVPTPPLVHREYAGVLLSSIDRLWDRREEQRRRIEGRMPDLRRAAERTVAICAELVSGAGDAAPSPS